MSKANWAEEDSDDDIVDISPEEALQEKLLDQVDRNRGSAPQRENRSRSNSNVSGGGGGDRSRDRGHRDQRGGPSGGDCNGQGGYQNNRGGDGYDRADRGRRSGGDQPPMEIPEHGPFVAYVGNLNYLTLAQTVGEYFVGGGCDVTDVKILTERDGRPRGFANVTFSDRESLVAAMEANGTELEGRSISVRVDRRAGSERKQSGYGGRDRRMGDDPSDGEAWGRGTKNERAPAPTRERREPRVDRLAAREGSGGSDPKLRPVIKIAPRSVPLETATANDSTPRSSSIFGDAKPVDVKEKVLEVKPKVKRDPKPKAEKEGSKGVKKGPAQRSDGAWTKEKVGDGKKGPPQNKDKKDKNNNAEKQAMKAVDKANAAIAQNSKAADNSNAPKSTNVFAGLMDDDSD